jgi:hypothetical protein
LFIIGAIFSSNVYSPGSHIIVAVFYGLSQFFFNLGECAEQQSLLPEHQLIKNL